MEMVFLLFLVILIICICIAYMIASWDVKQPTRPTKINKRDASIARVLANN